LDDRSGRQSGEKYLAAAWNLSQDPIAGDHLAQIYEKQGQLAKALETFELAKARAYPVVTGIDDRIRALQKRVGHSSDASLNASRLQDLRILHLPRLKPVSGSADFLVLFAAGKPTGVKMLGGDANVSEYGDVLRHTDFHVDLPDDGPEHVVRQGILSCSIYDAKCMFFMMLPADASTNSRAGMTLPPPAIRGETRTIKIN
jgi:hypothetical protein